MRQRLTLVLVAILGGVALILLRPRPRYVPAAEAQKQVDFAISIPAVMPAGAVLIGTKAGLPIRRVSDPRAIHSFTGLGIALDKDHVGVIGGVVGSSPALQAGLKNGDRILKINGQPMAGKSLNELAAVLRALKTYELEVQTTNGVRTVHLQVATFDPSTPDPPRPYVNLEYIRNGKRFFLQEQKSRPEAHVRWSGSVIREVDLDGTKGTLRRIGGHPVLVWSVGGVDYSLNDYQEGVSEREMIAMAKAIRG